MHTPALRACAALSPRLVTGFHGYRRPDGQ